MQYNLTSNDKALIFKCMVQLCRQDIPVLLPVTEEDALKKTSMIRVKIMTFHAKTKTL